MIGLALSGGSLRGAYEVGAYFAFKKCHIKFDGFVGTSIGSFNAAMLAAGRDRELLKFWQNIDVAQVLNLDDNFVKALKNKNLPGTIAGLTHIITNKGISTIGLKEALEKLNVEADIRRSPKDYGLVTVRVKPLKVLHLFKEDIPEGKMNDYIMGSCYFPGFKQEKIIDDKYYLDGGFYDAMPVNMLLAKNYHHVYAIDLQAPGIKQKIKDPARTTIIQASRPLGSIFTLSNKRINDNIKLGYYDTIKILKKLDGQNFIFKKRPQVCYDRMVKKISARRLTEVKFYFPTLTGKDLVIAVVEYFMKANNYDYLRIYNIKKVIRKLKKHKQKPYGLYHFIQDLKI